MRPSILITNDDGLDSPGIEALADALQDFADVTVVAPEREQSAVSHKITLHKPIRLTEVAPGRYACSGTPTDCVQIALGAVLQNKPDLVLSGINRGPNLGDDVIYSGTVGGAREAALWGLRSMALSLAQHAGPFDFSAAAQVARALTERLLASASELPDNMLVNVNFPEGVSTQSPWEATILGARNYTLEVSRSEDPRNKPYFWIAGELLGHDAPKGTDVRAIQCGRVSITPVPVRVTQLDALPTLAAWQPTRDHRENPGEQPDE